MKKYACLLLGGILAFSLVGCDKGNSGEIENTYTVELGKTFSLPRIDGDYDAIVKDAAGNEVKIQYGSFRPTVGNYTAEYTASKKKITIECQDTTAPSVTFESYDGSATVGDTLSIPKYKVTDLSEIKEQNVVVTKQDGSSVSVNNGEWIAENAVYKVTVTAEDVYGNVQETVATIVGRTTFIDATLEDKVIFDFNEAEYINLFSEVEYQEDFEYAIVTSGYPTVENAKENNGVLKLSTNYNYGDVYIGVSSYAPVKANIADKIIVRVAVDRETQYVKVANATGDVCGRAYFLKPNVWTDIEVDPIDFGYGSDFTDFSIFATADNGLNLYVDEIFYVENFIDSTLTNGTLADFDEVEYESRMYQNTYNGQWAAPGSSFKVVDYPTDSTRKVMQITTTESKGGFTYMFDEPIVLSEVDSLTITMDCSLSVQHLWLGTMQGTYKRGSSYNSLAAWHSGEDAWAKLEFGTMKNYVVPATTLSSWCVDGILTGIWISVIDGSYNGNILYIDNISVQYKTAE